MILLKKSIVEVDAMSADIHDVHTVLIHKIPLMTIAICHCCSGEYLLPHCLPHPISMVSFAARMIPPV